MKTDYLFTSERLGFRSWFEDDIELFAKMNCDEEVMKHFPKLLTKQETEAFVSRMQQHYLHKGYTYFAVELKETGEFIGFIGLAHQDYQSPYTPAVDIGWRLKQRVWGNGYATEGAKRCLQFAFAELNLDKVIATCTLHNKASENVMQKIGMKRLGTFQHPKLIAYPEYTTCIIYKIEKAEYQGGS